MPREVTSTYKKDNRWVTTGSSLYLYLNKVIRESYIIYK